MWNILKKFDNEQLDFEQIKKLENFLIQEREKAKQVQIKKKVNFMFLE